MMEMPWSRYNIGEIVEKRSSDTTMHGRTCKGRHLKDRIREEASGVRLFHPKEKGRRKRKGRRERGRKREEQGQPWPRG